MTSGWNGIRPGGSDTALTGRHVLGAFIAFFAAIFAMNGVLVWRAIATNAGLVANEPYRKGLHYNERIAAEERQVRLGWTDTLDVQRDGSVALVLADRAGQPVTGLTVETVLGRPATAREDVRLTLREVAPGRYTAHTAPLAVGSWLVAVEARADTERPIGGPVAAPIGEPIYRTRRRLWLAP